MDERPGNGGPQHGRSKHASWPESYEKLLRKHLPLLPAESALSRDASLIGLGLASLETVALLLDLEEQFDVDLPDELLTQETFETPASLWQAISSHA